MTEIYKLQNQIKNYEWGSQKILPDFLGLENTDLQPWAEMWMGTHSGAPSFALRAATLKVQGSAEIQQVPLSDLLAAEGLPSELPFLFKLLAVEKPLSLQAHPNREQAVQGLRRENAKALSIDDPSRNYKDANPKPEILCAISPFIVMAGFRQPQEISASLKALQQCAPHSCAPQFAKTADVLLRALETGACPASADASSAETAASAETASAAALKSFFQALFALSKQEIEDLSAFVCGAQDLAGEGNSGTCSVNGISLQQLELLQSFARAFPGDPSFLAPLFLNLFTLLPYQAIFLPAGILHAYIKGFGVELMASSDNVLRAGLTPKHVDVGELFNILDFKPYMPPVLTPSAAESRQILRYFSPCGLALSLLRGEEEIIFSQEGASLCVVIEGELDCNGKSFKKGESFFAAQKGDSLISFKGSFTLFAASADGKCADGEAQ